MDFSALPDIIGSLSTSGAQWYKLTSSPTSISVPGFAPTSQNAQTASLLNQGASALTSGGGLLLVGAIVLGALLIFRR